MIETKKLARQPTLGLIEERRPPRAPRGLTVALAVAGATVLYVAVAVETWRPPGIALTGFEVEALSIGPVSYSALPALAYSAPSGGGLWDTESWRTVLGAFAVRGRLLASLSNPSLAPLEASGLTGAFEIGVLI